MLSESSSNSLFEQITKIHDPWPSPPSVHEGNSKYETLIVKIFRLKQNTN